MTISVRLRIDRISADREIAASPEALRRDLSAALKASLTAHISGAPVRWPLNASTDVREIARLATEKASSNGALAAVEAGSSAPDTAKEPAGGGGS